MENSQERCKNCSQHLLLQQNYCHECGQKTRIHRIDLHYFVPEVPHSIFHVDGGILFTLKELFTRPGHTIREYLEGRRKPHFKPVMLVIIMGSICALIQYYLNGETKFKNDDLFKSNLGESPLANYVDFRGLVEYFKEVFVWLSSHFAFTVLLMLPITALGFYLGFRRYKINYPEWIVIFLFLAGQSLTIYVFFIFLNHYLGNYNPLFFLLIWILVTVSLIQFFEERGKKYVILRSLWAIFLSYFLTFLYVIFAILTVAVVGICLYGYDNILPFLMDGI